MAENSAGKQRGRPFEKGQSGNPSGKPRGTKNHATRLAERLFDGSAEDICRVIIDRAKEGDLMAAKIVVERLCPPRKDRPVSFPLPKIEGAQDLSLAAIGLLQCVADGGATPDEAASVMRIIEGVGKAIELGQLEARIQRLEKRVAEDEQGP